jgi:hypothetical protein
MGVLHHSILLARSVSSAKVYRDLVAVESDPPTFGVYDATTRGGEWIEVFDQAECIRRLREWPIHHSRPGIRLPYSAVTDVGQKWLAQHST